MGLLTFDPSASKARVNSNSGITGGLMGKMLKNTLEEKLENRMGVQDHQDKPLILQVKENEHQRGAVTAPRP